jgi:hypothetical protein
MSIVGDMRRGNWSLTSAPTIVDSTNGDNHPRK